MKSKFTIAASAVAIAFAVMTPSVASAQGGQAAPAEAEGNGLDDIVVTATRRAERLQDVPVAITALNGEQLQQAGVTRAPDLALVTPSLSYGTFVGRSDSVSLGIRGQRNPDTRLVNDPAVLPYVAEVPLPHPFGFGIVGFLDARSVEVVKGPVGTLFGKNSTGGAVLVTPNTPTDTYGGSVRMQVGNFRNVEGEGMINLPIAEGVGFRAAFIAGHHDGYIKNRGPFPDLNGEDYYGGRASFKFESGDFKSVFYGDYLHYRNSGLGVAIVAADPLGAVNAFPLGVGGGATAELAEKNASPFYSARTSTETGALTEVYGFSNTSSYQLTSELMVKNIVGYRNAHANSRLDTDGTAYQLLDGLFDEKVRQFTEELQLQYAGEGFKLIVGGFYFDEKGRTLTRSNVLRGLASDAIYDEPVRNRSKSLFAEGTVDITDKLHLTAGGRYTWDKREYNPSSFNDYSSNVLGLAPLGVQCIETGTTLLPTPDPVLGAFAPLPGCRAFLSQKFKKPTFNLTASYQFDDDHQVYASVRRGYRSGGWSSTSATAAQRIPFKPETVTNYELGFKGDFELGGDAALRLNVAAYYSDYRDVQKIVNYQKVNPSQFVSRIVNAARGEIKGIEVETTLRLNRQLELSGFYSLTDAKYKTYLSQIGENPNGTPIFQDRSGQAYGLVPKHKLSGSVRYTIPMENESELALYAIATYQTKTELDDNPAPGLTQKGYTLVNARVDYTVSNGLVLSAFGRNIFNAKYYDTGQAIYAALGESVASHGRPRTYGVELSYKF